MKPSAFSNLNQQSTNSKAINFRPIIKTLDRIRRKPAIGARFAVSHFAVCLQTPPLLTPVQGNIMLFFVIVELDDGFEIVEVLPGQSPEDAAAAEGGKLVDPGPYYSFEEANDALDQLEFFDEQQ